MSAAAPGCWRSYFSGMGARSSAWSRTPKCAPPPNAMFDFVTAGQAFHWFNPEGAHREFARILKPNGWLVLVWNERALGGGFQAAYETVVKDCAAERTRIEEDAIDRVYGHHDWR